MAKKLSRRERGLCYSCNEPAVEGRTRCQKHLDQLNEYAKKRRAEIKPPRPPKAAPTDVKEYSREYYANRYKADVAAGMCVRRCGSPKSADSVYCLMCLHRQRNRQHGTAVILKAQKLIAEQSSRKTWKVDGLCIKCGAERSPLSKFRCRTHHSNYLRKKHDLTQHEARKRAGLCMSCNTPVDGVVRCDACREKKKARNVNYIARGVCPRHPNKLLSPGKRRCDDCASQARADRQSRIDTNLCANCGERAPEDAGKKICNACLVYCRIKDKRKRVKLKLLVLSKYANGELFCFCCHEGNPDLLELDHIANDGAAHRRSICGKNRISGTRFYLWLKQNNYPSGLQLACATCNRSKHVNGGACVHQEMPPKFLAELRKVNDKIAAAVYRSAEPTL